MTDPKRPMPAIASGIPLHQEPGLGALTLSGFLREVSERHGDNEALVSYRDGSIERWTYSRLWQESVQVARALLACGVGKGTRVGVLMTNRLEWLPATFGAALAGATATCLSTFSTPSELAYLLKTSGVSVLLLEQKVLNKDFARILITLVPEVATSEPGMVQSMEYPYLRHLAMVGESEGLGAIEGWGAFLARGNAIAQRLVEATATSVLPCEPGVILFSSGSTANPKGVVNSHRGATVQLWRWARIYGMKPGTRTWTANGFFWSGNFVMAIGGTFACGGTLVLQSIFDPEDALRLMAAERVNCPLAWPHQWAQLEGAPNWLEADLGSVHYAESYSPFHRHPTIRTDWVEPIGAYGCTETFTIVTSFPACTPRPHKGGEILPGNTIKIVDPFTGDIVPRGQLGEIAVKGKTLMLEYLGIPLDETLDVEGFLHTGDSGYLDEDDLLFFEGRLSDVIKTGGANVSPLEIDKVLSTYPGVKACKTVGLPHDTLGEVVVGCIVLHQGVTLTEEEIRAFARQQLASYKVPRVVLFFTEDELATTGSNKIKTPELRELAARRWQGRSG